MIFSSGGLGEKLKSATGLPDTVIVWVVESIMLQVLLSMATSFTVKMPGVAKSFTGLMSVLVVPSPKSQKNCCPPELVLLNTALYGAQPDGEVWKLASTNGL